MSDESKPRITLVPLIGLHRISRVFEAGLRGGRAPGDWQHEDPQRFRDAMLRHAVDYADGRVTGEDELAAVAANAHILLWHEDRLRKDAAEPADATDSPREGAVCLERVYLLELLRRCRQGDFGPVTVELSSVTPHVVVHTVQKGLEVVQERWDATEALLNVSDWCARGDKRAWELCYALYAKTQGLLN